VTKEEETLVPLESIPSSSKNQPLLVETKTFPSYIPPSPNIHIINTVVVPVNTQSPPFSLRIYNPMASANLPRNRMDAIVTTRYAPLVLPQPMNALPIGDYLLAQGQT
jgi:hypothetical protein